MSLKTINIEPEHLRVSSNRKTKKRAPILSINEPNLRQVLLNKLIQRRKTQKKSLILPVNEGGFDDPQSPVLSSNEPTVPSVSVPTVPLPVPVPTVSSTCPITPDKPYGVLKSGTKPTFREWSLNNQVEIKPLTICETPAEIAIPIKVEPVEPVCVIKKIKVGKNKRTKSVDILIENIHTRKLNKDKLQLLKKTNINTIKNYLKNRQLIKVGSNAPNSLIRYMYENIKECGDVVNENKTNLIHNFTRDTS